MTTTRLHGTQTLKPGKMEGTNPTLTEETATTLLPFIEEMVKDAKSSIAIFLGLSNMGNIQSEVLFIILLGVIICGTVGNSLVIFVYYHMKTRISSDVFILILACSDLLVCVLIVPQFAYSTVAALSLYQRQLLLQLKVITVLFNAFTLVVLALDRLMAIVAPLKYTFSIRQAVITGALGGALSVLLILTFRYSMLIFLRLLPVYLSICLTLLILCYSGILLKVVYQGLVLKGFMHNKVVPSVQPPLHDDQTSQRTRVTQSVQGTGEECATSSMCIGKEEKTQPNYFNKTNRLSRNILIEVASVEPAGETKASGSHYSRGATRMNPLEENEKRPNRVQPTTLSSVTMETARKHNGHPGLFGGRRRQDLLKMVKVFLLVTAVFYITYLPILLLPLKAIPKHYMAYITFCTFIGNMVNPFIYCFVSSKFRRNLKQAIGHLKGKVCK